MSISNAHVSDNRATVQEQVQRPQWLDEQLYPFQSRFVEIAGNRIHYIDEGSGPILFFLHPSIGWSFIYADIIKDLRTRFRCIALDLPGFGLSQAAPGYQHTLTNDSLLIERFIQTLGLTDVTLFAHDITGSIGLGVVGRRPEWFRAVIILPGFVWPLEDYQRVYRMVQLVGSPLFRFLSVHFNLLLEYTLKSLTKKPKQPFSDQEKRAYREPMADHAVRGYPSDLFKSAVRSHDYLADLEQRLRSLKQMPALLIFGETDGLLKMGWLTRFERLFPRHRSIVMHGCHHFPQVYDAPGVTTAIRRWWDEEIEPGVTKEAEHGGII
jgi:haloalkane dehalogenase